MNTENSEKKCMICGKPSTAAVRDMKKQLNQSNGTFEFKPEEKTYFYCEEHKRESIITLEY